MPTFRHLQRHTREYGFSRRPLFLFSTMVLFWAVFDGIMSYVAPLVLVERGFSEGVMGLIIGSSSVFGAGFDLVLSRLLRRTDFRRIFLVLFTICAAYPVIILQANTAFVFVVAMGVWGLYFDLYNFGALNFLATEFEPKEHASAAGVILAFRGTGYLLAPVLAGLAVGEVVGWKPFAISWLFLGVAASLFVLLLRAAARGPVKPEALSSRGLAREAHIWEGISKLLEPLLTLTVLITVFDSFVWTLGPLVGTKLLGSEGLGGVFIVVYQLPTLLVGWSAGMFARRYGKEKVALGCFMAGSAVLCLLGFVSQPVVVLLVLFAASAFLASAAPAINGTYADYISSASDVEKEIEGADDFSVNVGYVIGPIAAGFLAQYLGELAAIGAVGALGLLLGVLLRRRFLTMRVGRQLSKLA